MKFTKQDLATFLVGLGAAILVSLAEALITVDVQTDLSVWGRNVLVGLATATGRYILTEMTQRAVD